jgi:hypothetical protein
MNFITILEHYGKLETKDKAVTLQNPILYVERGGGGFIHEQH